jgi:hypothetical protein
MLRCVKANAAVIKCHTSDRSNRFDHPAAKDTCMTFDSNRAWKEATAAVSANRDVLLALGGVFFLVPGLAFSLFMPQPQTSAEMDEKALAAVVSAYYAEAWPWLLASGVLQGIGTLSLLTLLTDRTRPTVGDAIRQGVAGMIPLIAAQILLGIGLGIAGGLIVAIAAATGVGALVAAAIAIVVMLAVMAAVRTSLTAPVIAVEGDRNPVRALVRSWRLTSGNGWRIGLFFLLVIAGFILIVSLAMALTGIVLTLVAGPDIARTVAALASSTLSALGTLYLVAILAAVHRQMAGPSGEAVGAVFD